MDELSLANAPREISPAMVNSPLAKLPPEIRDHIYVHALHFENGIEVNIGGQRLKIRAPKESQYPLALTQVCTQTRRECTSLFYGANTFCIKPSRDGSRNSEMIEAWLEQIGSVNRSALQQVEVDLGPWTPGYMPPSSVTRYTTTLPIQAASYITSFRAMNIPVTFSIEVRYSDILGLGRFFLTGVDLVTEERIFATADSKFEQACLRQAQKIEDYSAESRIESYAVIRLLMGLDRCRSHFADFLSSVGRELEIQRAIRDARRVT